MVALANQPASFGGAPGWGVGAAPTCLPPTKAGRLAGQATMYVGSSPCTWAPRHVWVLHHVSAITKYSKHIRVCRYQKNMSFNE